MENFGEKLKELRLEKGLTQKELARELGNAQSAIYYWETNKQEPTLSALKKLCKFFDVFRRLFYRIRRLKQPRTKLCCGCFNSFISRYFLCFYQCIYQVATFLFLPIPASLDFTVLGCFSSSSILPSNSRSLQGSNVT